MGTALARQRQSITPMYVSPHAVDAGIIVVYLAASLVLGTSAARIMRTVRTREDGYYLANRRVPAWANGVSYAATLVNADVAPAYCGMAIVVGLPVAWFYMSRFSLGLLLIATLFAVRWYQLNVRTGPEFFSLRFGGTRSRVARFYASLYGVAIGMVPWMGAGLLGLHMIFAPIFDIQFKAVTLAIVLPVIVGYVWISGYAGVVVTDVAQTVVILVANVVLLVVVLWEFGGPAQLAASVEAALPDRAAEILSPLPVWGHEVMGPIVVCAWMLVSTIGVGGNVALDGQRLFSCKSAREAASMTVWAQVALFAMLALLTLPTLGVLVRYPEMYTADPSVRETAYGLLLNDFLPTGLLGVALAALLASVMSTVSSYISYGSQTLVNDVCRQIVPRMTDYQAVQVGRFLMLLIIASAIVVMMAADSLVGIAIVVSGMFGSTLTFSWGQWWWWRVNFWSWCAAMIGGPVVYLTLGWLLPHWPWWQEQAAISQAAAQGMAILRAAIAMAVTTAIWIVVALVTPPEPMNTLRRFYLQARPMGVWGPVRRAVEAEHPDLNRADRRRHLILPGAAIALIGAAWIALGVVAVSGLVVGRYVAAVGLLLSALPIACLFRQLFRWHLNRLEA